MEQPKSGERLNDLLRKVEARIIKVALRARSVAERLKDKRYEVLGADLPVFKGSATRKSTVNDEKRSFAEIGIYDYDSNVLVVSIVDLRKGIVTNVEERRAIQPPLTPREEEGAKKIVFADARYRTLGRQSRLRIVAYPVRAAFIESHAYYGHRCFVLHFWTTGKGSRRTARAVVDLSTLQLVPEDAVKPPFDQEDEL